MDAGTLFRLALVGFCLILSAFFSSSETALFSLKPLRVRKFRTSPEGSHKAIARLLEKPRHLIVTILIGNELVNVAVSVLVAAVALSTLGSTGKFYAMVVSTVLLLVCGEVIPKTYAVHHAETHARLISRPLLGFQWLVTPIRSLLGVLLSWLSAKTGDSQRFRLTEEEFKTLVEVGHSEGVLEADEKELIHSVVAFGDTRVREIMTPRPEMVCLEESASPGDVLDLIREKGFSRVPVYRENKDHIVGLLYVKDLLRVCRDKGMAWNPKDLLRPVYFVPQTKLVNELLKEFQAKKIHMAIVVDEHGGVAGLVTMEDVLEELFGEIEDEQDTRAFLVREVGEGEWLVAGRVSLKDIESLLGVALAEEGFETVGGYVFHCFGRLPKVGESIRRDDVLFTVEKMDGPRILELRIQRTG